MVTTCVQHDVNNKNNSVLFSELLNKPKFIYDNAVVIAENHDMFRLSTKCNNNKGKTISQKKGEIFRKPEEL